MKSISSKAPFKVRIAVGQLFPHSSHVVWAHYTFCYDNFEEFDRFVQEASNWSQPDSYGYLAHITSTTTPDRPHVRWSSKTRKPIGFGRKDFAGYFSDKDMCHLAFRQTHTRIVARFSFRFYVPGVDSCEILHAFSKFFETHRRLSRPNAGETYIISPLADTF